MDDKVIKQLWEENQDLRDQVHQLKTDTPTGEDGKFFEGFMDHGFMLDNNNNADWNLLFNKLEKEFGPGSDV